VEGMTKGKETAAKKSGNGRVKQLRTAASNIVKREREINESLLKALSEGKFMSTTLLEWISKGGLGLEEALKTKPFHSLAMQLAAEHPWAGKVSDEDAEIEDEGPEVIQA